MKGVGVNVGVGVTVGVGVSVGSGVADGGIGCPSMGDGGCPGNGVGLGVAVGGKGINLLGSSPGGIIMTPGVPSIGGVTMITLRIIVAVWVKVGSNTCVGTAVGVGWGSRSLAEQPKTSSNKTMKGKKGNRRDDDFDDDFNNNDFNDNADVDGR